MIPELSAFGLSLVVSWFLLKPLLQATPLKEHLVDESPPFTDIADAEARYLLEELQFDLEMGAIDQDDYERLKAQLAATHTPEAAPVPMKDQG